MVYDLEYRGLIDSDLTERAIEYIDRASKEEAPFFLYLAYTATHYPVIPHPDFDGATGNGPWADLLHQTDTYIGRVTAKLEELEIKNDTFVIFTADNGPEANVRTYCSPILGSQKSRYLSSRNTLLPSSNIRPFRRERRIPTSRRRTDCIAGSAINRHSISRLRTITIE